MAENEQQERSHSSSDAGDAAKKRRRRRGKRRPSGEGGSSAGAESDAPESAERPQAASADGESADSGDGQKRSRNRRRKKKRPEDGGTADGEATSAAPADTAAEAKPESSERRGPRGRREPKGRPEKKERAPRGSVLDRRRTRGETTLDFPDDDEPIVPAAPVPVATSVDGYVKQLRGWQREVVMSLRSIVKSQGGELEEQILWSQPVYTLNGPICYIKAFSDHVNLGFWRGNELDDPAERLVGDLPTMRHVTIRHVNEVDRDLFEGYVRQAVKLNKEKGDPTGV